MSAPLEAPSVGGEKEKPTRIAVCWWFGTLAECREPEKCKDCGAYVNERLAVLRGEASR